MMYNVECKFLNCENILKDIFDFDGYGFVDRLYIKDVKYNTPATIVFWSDGTKTVVRCNDDIWDKEKGLAMAICKKVYGNRGNFNEEFKKWCY